MPADRGVFRHRLWFLATIACASACGGTGDDRDDPDASGEAVDAAPGDAAGGYRAERVREDRYVRDDRSFPIELIRVIRPDGGRTYLQWIGSDKPGPRPVVVATDPYSGIDWSGEDVDLRWAGRASGTYQDVDGPGYDGDATVVYYPTSVQEAASQELPHLLNDVSVLRVHGRFYAGGSVRDEIEDMKAGMWWLAERSTADVDRARIGVYGGSWGGFESLYASGYGDRRVAPSVTVALYPPLDFASWIEHAESRDEPAYAGLEGHRRRIYAGTGGGSGRGGDVTGLTTQELCAGLPADTLVLHDEIDNLVPIAQSEDLVATCGADAVYWRRAAAVDPGAVTHGALLEEPVFPSVSTYALAYLHRRLAAADQVVFGFVVPAALVAHLSTVRDAQVRGDDVGFAAPRLRELCDPRLYLFDLNTAQLPTGAAVVAAAVNQVWGTSHDAASIDAALATGLPPP